MDTGLSSGLQKPLVDSPHFRHSVSTRSPADNQTQQQCEENAHERAPTPLPRLQLSVILYIQLAEPMTFTIILPFIVKLVEETGVTGGDLSKVGYYAGLVESMFFFAQAFTILQWGRTSDRIGRRPVLLFGLFGSGISMLLFGLSHTLWTVVASRALAGALNGNSGILKCMMGEITDETNVAQGFAFVPITWALGNTLGPLIGGLLQHPYERFGGVFEHRFWKINPYFLPCSVAALYWSSACLFSYFALKETAPAVLAARSAKHGVLKRYNSLGVDNGTAVSETPSTVQPTENTPLVPPPKTPDNSLRVLLTPRVTVVILNYALFSIIDLGFVALQPLFLSTPIANGGLGMSPSMIGVCLSAVGILNGIVCALFLPPLEKRFGARNVFTSCVVAYLGCFALWPVMNAVARAEGGLGRGVWALWIFQLILVTLTQMAFTCVFIFLSAATPRSAMGATTGMAQTSTAFVRSLVPAGASSLFAASMEHDLLGGNLVYVVFGFLTVCSAMATMLFPARPWKRQD